MAEDAHFHAPVAVFATFESDKSYEAALKMKQLRLHNGLTVSIKGAPEPETILWRNLQYTRKQRRGRVVAIILCTVAVLLIGVWLIVMVRSARENSYTHAARPRCFDIECNCRCSPLQVGKLKDRNSYTSGCESVVGPLTNVTNAGICPHALDAATPYPQVYRDSYQSLSDALATTDFPRITSFEVCSTMRLLPCSTDAVDREIS